MNRPSTLRLIGLIDWLAVAGLLLLSCGLWLWFGTGPALTALGSLLLIVALAASVRKTR